MSFDSNEEYTLPLCRESLDRCVSVVAVHVVTSLGRWAQEVGQTIHIITSEPVREWNLRDFIAHNYARVTLTRPFAFDLRRSKMHELTKLCASG